MEAPLGVYRPRDPEKTPFYRCLEDYWEEFQRGYEVLFESVYGPLRVAVTRAVDRFLKCGILHYGFARLKCQECGRNRFLAYSCRTRQLCPSCAAKRVAAFTEWVAFEVLEPVSDRQVVFTIPKVLRPVFRKNRKLLGLLCRCAWQTLKEMHQGAFAEEEVRGVAVIAVHTAADQLQWHPQTSAGNAAGAGPGSFKKCTRSTPWSAPTAAAGWKSSPSSTPHRLSARSWSISGFGPCRRVLLQRRSSRAKPTPLAASTKGNRPGSPDHADGIFIDDVPAYAG